MNCKDWEDRLALYVGGDLPAAQAVEVEHHLGECPGCQVFASGLREAQELLLDVHREDVAPAHFAAVRARVLAQIESERRPFWRVGWIWALVPAALVLLAILWIRQPFRPELPPPVVAMAHPVPPPLVAHGEPVAPRSVAPRLTAVAASKRPAQKTQPGEPVLVRVVSDDPDVIIYWIAETRGE